MTFFFVFSEYVKLLKADGSEVFIQQGCNSSYPAGTALEVPYGATDNIILDVFIEYRWSAVNIKYNILNHGLDSGLQPTLYYYFNKLYAKISCKSFQSFILKFTLGAQGF